MADAPRAAVVRLRAELDQIEAGVCDTAAALSSLAAVRSPACPAELLAVAHRLQAETERLVDRANHALSRISRVPG